MILFNKSLNVELINAVVVGLEIADSRAVWVVDKVTGDTKAMPFEGFLIYLPFILISYGNVYDEVVV